MAYNQSQWPLATEAMGIKQKELNYGSINLLNHMTSPHLHMSRNAIKRSSVFPTRSDKNWPVQLQKQARGLKFWLKVEEKLYYPSSENKYADQLRSYCTADLRLWFCICRLLVFL